MAGVCDILRKRAERLFKEHPSGVTDSDLLQVFRVKEIKQLEKAGLIHTEVDHPAWYWIKEGRGR